MPKISIIVVTYNAIWEKLRVTINSILIQSGIDYEIIFADDGSKIKWNDKIIEYIPNGYNYYFADSEKNVGTVSNIMNGINKSKGDFIKVISPGDYLNGKAVLREWIDFMNKSNADLSFCNAIYYKNENCKAKVIKSKASPKNSYLYHKYNESEIFVDYLLANDSILGASVLVKKNIILQYLKVLEGKVKYAEDYMIRLMIYDGRKIEHMNKAFIWYEYGDGISTKNNSKWAILLHKDFDAVNEIIKSRNIILNKRQKRYKELLMNKKCRWMPHKIKKIIFFPTMLLYRIQMKYFYHSTSIESINTLNQIINYKPIRGIDCK